MGRGGVAGVSLGVLTAALVASCEVPRTQLVVGVDTELTWGVGGQLQSVTLEVRRGGPNGALRSLATTALGSGGDRASLPLWVTVLSIDDSDASPVWFEALGCARPDGCTRETAVVSQRASVRFVARETGLVRLLLAGACVSRRCALTERCAVATGECVGVEAQGEVRAYGGTLPGRWADASVAGDAPVVDAATDQGMLVDVVTQPDVPAAVDVPAVDVPAVDVPAVDVPAVDVPAVDVPAVDVATDQGRSCPTGATLCSGACVSLATSASNCGACGNVCAVGQGCAGGSCAGGCPTGMRLIPAGMFQMGDTGATHGVQLSAFCMDETEVTVSAYSRCAACTAPGTDSYANWGVSGRESHPVNYVDWNQARAFCQSRGGDLPTESQWEYAARGTDGRTYPWGNDAPAHQLCWSGEMSRTSTCPVRTYPSGNSPFGLFDMAGNVWEWTADYHAAYTGSAGSYVLNPTGPVSGSSRVLRGGSLVNTSATNARASGRFYTTPTYRIYDVGFRCARGAI